VAALAIDDMLAAAAIAWPDVTVEREAFATHVQTVTEDAVERCGADLVLAFACAHQHEAAIAHFEQHMLAPARATIRSFEASDAFVEEACQRLRAHLLVGDDKGPRIATYAGHGPLRAWVAVAASRTALQMLRANKRQREVSENDWADAIGGVAIGDPELDLLKRNYALMFSAALREAAAVLEPRLQATLRMHFIDELSIDEIAAVYRVHRATAARWIQRAREILFVQTRRYLAEQLALTPNELDRVAALVHSQLEVSLSQLLPAR
jgi:RNA polymerase sigma-70 factor, ECF subfamily